MENYSVLGRIGEGAHGSVLLGKRKSDEKEVALKKISVKKIEDGIPTAIIREIKTMQVLHNPYVMRLLDHFPKGTGFVLVFDYMPSGLWEMIHDVESSLTESLVKSYMKMLLKGLDHMHKNGIMHRDLKPANLLIGSDGILKIGDFGQARTIWKEKNGKRPYTQQVATRWYRAPELLYGARLYTEAIDLWAVGCIFAEMFLKRPLFQGETDIDQLALVIKCLGTPSEENWPGHAQLPDFNKITFAPSKPQPWDVLLPGVPSSAQNLTKELVKYDSGRRIRPHEALNHKYFFSPPKEIPERDLPRPHHDHRTELKTKDLDGAYFHMFQDLNFLLDSAL
uniref:Cyclin-dependent kinase 20 n=1 Tax=Lygus hesperus TaxID=30085 RepID=A0A0A9WHZ5_LYGHE